MLTAFALLVTMSATAADKPNIIVILCDDLGYGDLECYGHPHIKTPNLNRLAGEGLRFTDFYSAAPVCSPARVGLLTGRSPNRAGVYHHIREGEGVFMRASETTIPNLLKKAGYATSLFGKWHCNGVFNSPVQPQPDAAGFDYWFATQNNAAPSHKDPENFVRNGENVGPLKGFSCQVVTDEALNWIDRQQTEDPEKPFFIYLAFHEPHEPVVSPADLVEQYGDVARNGNEAQYFANVANVDAAVGSIMAALKKREIDEKTLVIFTSDNGPETLLRYEKATRSYGIAEPLRGMKLWTTDGGFRVPGIMRWPGRIKPGGVVSQPVSSLDFLPTFCELAGTEPPSDLVLDGTSLLSVLNGGKLEREKPLLWIFYSALNGSQVAMRDGDWKVLAKLAIKDATTVTTANAAEIKKAVPTDFRIYRMDEEISENNDLSDTYPAKLVELKTRLEKSYKDLVSDSYVWEKPNVRKKK